VAQVRQGPHQRRHNPCETASSANGSGSLNGTVQDASPVLPGCFDPRRRLGQPKPARLRPGSHIGSDLPPPSDLEMRIARSRLTPQMLQMPSLNSKLSPMVVDRPTLPRESYESRVSRSPRSPRQLPKIRSRAKCHGLLRFPRIEALPVGYAPRMARAGETIENPVTGERLVFLTTAQETSGELLRVEHVFAPGALAPATHLHPHQVERFEVLSGMPRFRIGDGERTARQGDVVAVPAGTPHTWWNAGADETRVLIEFRPALRTEEIFQILFGLGRDGKLNKRSVPNPFLGAVLAREYESEARVAPSKEILLTRLPPRLIRLLIAVLAPLGRSLGYGRLLRRYGSGAREP
jgi:mannose-6-phosphate isomerase-like protein (cupin superfamily)